MPQSKIEEILEILAETPDRIETLSKNLTSVQLQKKLDQRSWSANDILAHLRACADLWGKDIDGMLEQDTPTLPHISPRIWLRNTDCPELKFRVSFEAFAEQRSEFLMKLKSLEFDDWLRGAVIKGRTHTVFRQVRRMVLYEQVHREQIETIAKGHV